MDFLDREPECAGCRDAAHGVDERQVEPMKTRRSVGAEVNWGIRFTCQADADTFLDGIAGALPIPSSKLHAFLLAL